MRLTHRSAIALYVVTLVAAVITLVDSGPARADGPGEGAPWTASAGGSHLRACHASRRQLPHDLGYWPRSTASRG